MKTKIRLKNVEDIPQNWKVLNARKKTKVNIRPSNGIERFKVFWSDCDLVSDPDLDVIVIAFDGSEYPCKKDIFRETYEKVPDSEQYVKKAINILVEVPEDFTVEVETLEGVVDNVEYPDYVVIGARGELYVNTRKFVDEEMELL
jgi:hypothetical protein